MSNVGSAKVTLEELQAGAGSNYLFHYTDQVGADGIIEESIFATGIGAVYGPGVYATDIAPVDEATIDEVITNCFGGDAIPPEVNYAVALRMNVVGVTFTPVGDGYQWVASTEKLDLVQLPPAIYVATAVWDGTTWDIDDDSEN